MIYTNLQARAERQVISDAISLYFFMSHPGSSKISILSDFQFIDVQPEEAVDYQRRIDLPMTAAQELMDELWRCGLRPTEGSGSVGSLKATQDHLDDLRLIVDRLFKLIEREDE